ncbi:gluconeogenesis factor YvcK family protein [Deinococcus maricopensis]|uniref:Putative gluconeogenesis factor n=1 Tax=Deinococcus maricopensis (strain DSM 21211 / LMG 22137 / NRRL B-23946 / LB-34) TaxID=709986 RepID=E8U9T4_DEIML|nr:uridine diphosphate-N-acetylglucosamine-binding protein YvcK [Deinococcus maricopensis]ADV67823.1 Uncharacterized protein family UPF0052 [Deinococcus maricopensis DSM 21211]
MRAFSVHPDAPVQARRAVKWLAPGMGVKRWVTLFVACAALLALGFMHLVWTGPLHFVATRWILRLNALVEPGPVPLWVAGAVVMALAFVGAVWSVLMLNRSLLYATGTSPSMAVDVIYSRRSLSRGARIVAIGGGTGLSNLLAGLKAHTGNITAIVTVADDGGSSGRLREALDMIAPGDLTDCLAALSDSPVLARLLLHRFRRGEGLEGHTFGNLMLATLSEEQGGLQDAMSELHEVLNICGRVYPATTKPATLLAHLEDGSVIAGESQLAVERAGRGVTHITLEPPDLPALPAVLEAIASADMIVLGPGSLFTSLIPAILVPDVAHALRASSAPIVYVASLMTEPGETDGLTLEEHERMIARHLNRAPDVVLVNSAPIPLGVRERYSREGAHVLGTHGYLSGALRRRVRYAPVLQQGHARHDPAKLAAALLALLSELPHAHPDE